MCDFLICFSGNPQEPKGKNQAQHVLYSKLDKPNTWETGMKDAPCAEPLACCCASLCFPCGFTTCYFRKAAIEEWGKFPDDYQCFQGYIPGGCCGSCLKPCIEGSQGNVCCLCLEGCCCPLNGLQCTRFYVMDAEDLQPDPCDWKIIECSNCLQLLSCICHCAAMFYPDLEEAAELIDCIADCFTVSMAGCMGAQLCAQIKKHQISNGGAPALTLDDENNTKELECVPQAENIERK